MSKSSNMPEPQVLNYEVFYKVTPQFIADLNTTLMEIAYVDAKPIFDTVEQNGGILPIAAVNGLIRSIGRLPFKYVSAIMHNIQSEEAFKLYFQEVKIEAQKNG